MHRPTLAAFVLAAATLLGGSYLLLASARPARGESSGFSEYVDAKGDIRLPEDYLTTFAHLGTFTVSEGADGPVKELHGVYARPDDVRAFRRDGKFPDGAVLVKDVLKTRHAKLTTGDASWAGDMVQWFVMVKDARGRFPDNDLWGEGWGWALFEAKDPKRQVAVDYRNDCRVCHLPAKRDDWLYLRGYPTLRSDRR